jgi:hypothetical protein
MLGHEIAPPNAPLIARARKIGPLSCRKLGWHDSLVGAAEWQTRWTQNPPVFSTVFPCSERIYSDSNNLRAGRNRSRTVAFGGKR